MSPVIYCILPWKWKQWSYGYRMVVKRVGYLPLGSQGWLGATGSGGLPSIVNVWYWHNTRPGKKNQNLKFEVQFLLHEYCFCTIVKSKSHKSDHRELGGASELPFHKAAASFPPCNFVFYSFLLPNSIQSEILWVIYLFFQHLLKTCLLGTVPKKKVDKTLYPVAEAVVQWGRDLHRILEWQMLWQSLRPSSVGRLGLGIKIWGFSVVFFFKVVKICFSS